MKTLIIKPNPDSEKFVEMSKAVKDNNGYCPCLVDRNEDTKCLCKAFREKEEPGACLCGRFLKEEMEIEEEVAEAFVVQKTINKPDGRLSKKEMENLMTSVDIHSGNGVKLDQGKPRWELLPYRELEEVVKVLTFGAKKYAPDNWQKVEDGKNRYFGACLRHLTAWKNGEKIDKESKLSHLGHAICCILFMLWFDKETPEEVKEGK